MTTDDTNTTSWRRDELGTELRALREAHGRSLRSVATAVGLSHSHLAKLERGEWKRPPASELLVRLGGALGTPPEELAQLAGLELVMHKPDAWPSGAEQFSRLMLDEHFGPQGWRPAYLEHVPPLHRKLIVALAVNAFQRGVEAGQRGYGKRIEEVLGMAWIDAESPGGDR